MTPRRKPDPTRRALREIAGQVVHLRPTSKDDLMVHARQIAGTFDRYERIWYNAWNDARVVGAAIDMDALAAPLRDLSLATDFYALGLIGALARAFAAEHDRANRLAAHLREQATHLTTRIADGDEMGASVWRIALADAVRENRAALEEAAE